MRSTRRLLALATLMCVAVVVWSGGTAGAALLATGGSSFNAFAAACGTDEFDGPTLDPRWTVLRRDDSLISFAGGDLNLGMGTGDLITGTATAQNVITQETPTGGWVATTTFNIAQIDANGEQAGLALWGSEGANNNTFAKAVFIQTNNGTRRFEAVYTDKNELARPIAGSAAYAGPADADVSMRMRSDGRRVVTEYSLDGTAWTLIGDTATFNGPLRVGLVAMRGGAAGGVVPYERFTLECGPDVAVAATPASGAAPLTVDLAGTVSDPAATLEWSFGDGQTATGGLTQTHAYAAPGIYRVELRATSASGVATVGSALVTVRPPGGACPQRSDEFDGNALDPTKWEVLRPVPSRMDVSGGRLNINGLGGDQHGGTANVRNLALQTAPAGPWDVVTRLDVSALTNSGQAGLIVWRSEGANNNNFAKIVYNRRSATTFWVERQNNINSVASGGSTATVTASPTHIYLRARANNAANPTITADYSLDGVRWTAVQGGFTMGGSGPIKVGVAYFDGNTGRTMRVESFELGSPGECADSDVTPPATAAVLDPAAPATGPYLTPVGVTLQPFDNVGGSGVASSEYRVDGGDWQPYSGRFVVSADGAHVVDYRSTDAKNNVETPRSVNFTIDACAVPGAPEAGFQRLWNGVSTAGWRQTGPGGFDILNDGDAEGCRLVSRGGLGLFWFAKQRFDEFVLRMQWKTADDTDNSGVFVRFPRLNTDVNWSISQGHEIQIREGVQGDGENQKTGSIYNFEREKARNANPAGQWNDYEIRYEDDKYTITLNGVVVNTWTNTKTQGIRRGFIGLQNHGNDDQVSFRNIRIQDLAPPPAASVLDTIGITDQANTARGEIYGGATNYSFPAELLPPGGSVLEADNDALDDVPLRMPDTTGETPNLAAMAGQLLTLREADRKVFDKVHLFGAGTDGSPTGTFTFNYADGTSETASLQFRDWAQPGNQQDDHHIAVGPMGYRHSWGGQDAPVPFYLNHMVVDLAQSKQLVSIRFPDMTPTGVAMGYLMAVTLEEEGTGGYELPNLTGEDTGSGDETPPQTGADVLPENPDGENGWYLEGPVTVDLVGSDAGSGVARTQYRVDGGAFQTFSAPFEISEDGDHLVQYRSIDRAGNAEPLQSVRVKIDSTLPIVTTNLDPEEPAAAGWYDTAVELSLVARDGVGSGISLLEYRIGSGSWRVAAGPLSFGDPGTYRVGYRATDMAGNVSDEGLVVLKVDAAAPTTTAQLAPQPVGVGPATVTLTSDDGSGSGPAGTEYSLDGGQWQAYSGPITVSGAGAHNVQYRSRDVAGNLENAKELAFTITSPLQANERLAPGVRPFASIGELPDRVTVRALRRGLRISAHCSGAESGRARLVVTRAAARRLGLRSRTLATETAGCDDAGRLQATLEPSARVKRALARLRGTLRATLVVSVAASTDREGITLRGKRRAN